MTAAVEQAALAPGYAISRIVKGGWQLAGGHGPVEPARAARDMLDFVDAGITTFDCADIYTGAEEMIGSFLALLRRERGAEAARRVRVHTKFVPDRSTLPDLGRRDIERIIDRSRARLGLERLDLVQFHWWDYGVPRFVETAAVLAELQRAGKIDRIGVTNFDAAHLEALLAAGMPVLSAQVQYSLLDDRPAGALHALCAAHGIHLLCYGVLAGGFFAEPWLGAPEPAAITNRSQIKYKLIIDEFGGWDLFQELLAVVAGIARRHGVSIANVATRWVLDRPGVAAAIIGARYADRLADTVRAFDVALDAEDRAAIEAVRARRRGPAGAVYGLERDITGPHGRIMRYELNRAPEP